ncbi:cyclase [Heliobacillus mobilis]|uniref:Cyclase n=1 Tax=Heliobacterium mobile TaxID=28064 RepID=A0A6I3SBI1_HELMO|nr:aromatase/cyclase [Heliobacterium mobile]MTV47453.1 cyclase [Heliobacterium mobile]
MPSVEVSLWIDGSPEEVFELASRMEEYPRFMEDVRSVKVIEQGDGYTVTDWVTEVDGKSFCWKERDEFYPAEGKIRYRQIAGDVKRFEGEWFFRRERGGCQAVLTVDFDLGMPMLAPILHPVLKKKVRENSQAMLAAIKEKVESGSSQKRRY